MYDDQCATCSETYASFRLFHDELNPDAVSQQLGIQPTDCHRRGDVQNPKARRPVVYKAGMWLISSRGGVQSRDIRRHVDWLLDQLQPSGEALRRLQAAGCEADIFCYWFCAAEHGGPRLSPAQLARLAEMGIEISFDIYFTGADEN